MKPININNLYLIITDVCGMDNESKPVALIDVIFDKNDIQFEFNNGDTLPYNDFLYYQSSYLVRIVDMK